MDRGRRLMGHMVEGLDQDISWTKMIELEVENGWTHLTGEVVLMNFILPLVLRDIIVIVAIIIIGVRIGIFQRSSRKSSLLLFMERWRKSEDTKAWLLGMKKFFELHDYSKNIKSKITTFSFKGKAYIWWEGVKHVKGIIDEELIQDEFDVRRCRTIIVLNLCWISSQEGLSFVLECIVDVWYASYLHYVRGVDSWGSMPNHSFDLCNNWYQVGGKVTMYPS